VGRPLPPGGLRPPLPWRRLGPDMLLMLRLRTISPLSLRITSLLWSMMLCESES
jgi:hypothetical protein